MHQKVEIACGNDPLKTSCHEICIWKQNHFRADLMSRIPPLAFETEKKLDCANYTFVVNLTANNSDMFCFVCLLHK